MISFIVHSSQAQFTTEGKKNLSICLFLLRVLRGEPINQAWVLLRTTSPCVEPTGQRQPVLIAFNCWLLGGPQASCFWEPQVSPRHIAFFWRNNLENKVWKFHSGEVTLQAELAQNPQNTHVGSPRAVFPGRQATCARRHILAPT